MSTRKSKSQTHKETNPDRKKVKKKLSVKEETTKDGPGAEDLITQPKRTLRKRKTATAKTESEIPSEKIANDSVKKRKSRKLKVDDKSHVQIKVEKEIPTRKKLANLKDESEKVKKPKDASKPQKYVGAHCSIAGGLYKAVLQSVEMGGTAFGMFLKSQRQWAAKPLAEKDALKFKETCQEYNFPPNVIVPHGSYLMNCGSPDEETLRKSRDALVDELQRCEMLGLTLFNFHPGSTCGKIDVQDSIRRIAESINLAHKKTKYVIAVVENMSCQGNTIGGKFSELRDIIHQVKDKSRIGVCLDTCHAFAAGYDSTTQEGYDSMMDEFGKIVGFKFLKAMHFNDSKGECGCHLDRHENIGKGKIGLDGFRRYMNDPRLDNIPFVLETPEGDYGKEIRRLYSLCAK